MKIINDLLLLAENSDILLLAENINIKKPGDLTLKSANLDNILNLDNTVWAWKHLISRMLENFRDV